MDATNIIQFRQESSKILFLEVCTKIVLLVFEYKYVAIVLGISIIFVTTLDNFV